MVILGGFHAYTIVQVDNVSPQEANHRKRVLICIHLYKNDDLNTD